jgi:hypothetical protein
MPDNFKMATLFPDDAMRVRRFAEPLSVVEKDENVSVYKSCQSLWWLSGVGEERTYGAVDNVLVARIVVDVYRYATERRDLRGQLIQSRVVLLLALVGLRHDCSLRLRVELAASGWEKGGGS